MGLFDFLRKKETDVERYQRDLDARRSASAAVAPAREQSGSALLQVEDVFAITGRGTVVVGKCTAPFGVRDAVIVINPDGSRRESVVMGLEMFRQKCDHAEPGDNVGVLLRGLTRQDVARGAWIRKK